MPRRRIFRLTAEATTQRNAERNFHQLEQAPGIPLQDVHLVGLPFRQRAIASSTRTPLTQMLGPVQNLNGWLTVLTNAVLARPAYGVFASAGGVCSVEVRIDSSRE
jgi:hypothetical protein